MNIIGNSKQILLLDNLYVVNNDGFFYENDSKTKNIAFNIKDLISGKFNLITEVQFLNEKSYIELYIKSLIKNFIYKNTKNIFNNGNAIIYLSDYYDSTVIYYTNNILINTGNNIFYEYNPNTNDFIKSIIIDNNLNIIESLYKNIDSNKFVIEDATSYIYKDLEINFDFTSDSPIFINWQYNILYTYDKLNNKIIKYDITNNIQYTFDFTTELQNIDGITVQNDILIILYDINTEKSEILVLDNTNVINTKIANILIPIAEYDNELHFFDIDYTNNILLEKVLLKNLITADFQILYKITDLQNYLIFGFQETQRKIIVYNTNNVGYYDYIFSPKPVEINNYYIDYTTNDSTAHLVLTFNYFTLENITFSVYIKSSGTIKFIENNDNSILKNITNNSLSIQIPIYLNENLFDADFNIQII